jgi:hypothetical protein
LQETDWERLPRVFCDALSQCPPLKCRNGFMTARNSSSALPAGLHRNSD